MTHQECINCKATYDIDEIVYFCKKCGDILEIKIDFKELAETLKDSDWKKTRSPFGVTATSCPSTKPQK